MAHQTDACAGGEDDVAAIAAVGVCGRAAHAQIGAAHVDVAAAADEQCAGGGRAAVAAVAAGAANVKQAADADASRATRNVTELNQAVIVVDCEPAGEAVTVRSATMTPMAIAAVGVGGSASHAKVRAGRDDVAAAQDHRAVGGSAAIAAIAEKSTQAADTDASRPTRDVTEQNHAVIPTALSSHCFCPRAFGK